MPQLTAVLLDCSLAPSPQPSGIEALMRRVVEFYDRLGMVTETVRVADCAVRVGLASDEGDRDGWPLILAKITAANVVVLCMPPSYGARSSVAQLVVERLAGTIGGRDDDGRFPLRNKIDVESGWPGAAMTLGDLSRLGCTIPPHAAAYSESSAARMAHNTMHFARLLAAQPIPAEAESLEAESDRTTAQPLPHKLFGALPNSTDGLDPATIEAERRAVEDDRILERRRLLDLTWREKGLPEKRKPRPPIDPLAEGDAKP
jgi:multimeric flavodoxin WrbA